VLAHIEVFTSFAKLTGLMAKTSGHIAKIVESFCATTGSVEFNSVADIYHSIEEHIAAMDAYVGRIKELRGQDWACKVDMARIRSLFVGMKQTFPSTDVASPIFDSAVADLRANCLPTPRTSSNNSNMAASLESEISHNAS
jgi:hypothetical protein